MAYRTLTAEHVPKVMRIPNVKSGYRLMNQPTTYYLKSLFHWHNETVNVWSHWIGSLWILTQCFYYFKLYSEKDSPLRWTVVGHGLCCILTLLNSSVAHLLHSKSCYVNFVVFMFDYIGVVHWVYGTSILAIYGVSEESSYNMLIPHFLKIQVALCLVAYLTMCVSKLLYGHDLHIKSRKYMIMFAIVIPGCGNVLPWFRRYLDCYWSDDCNMSSMNHVTVVCIFFALVALSFILHQPEKCLPGKFDHFGQSHQIFHVIVIITQSLQIRCLYIDFLSKANAHCKPDISEILLCILFLYTSCALSLVYLLTHIKRKVVVD